MISPGYVAGLFMLLVLHSDDGEASAVCVAVAAVLPSHPPSRHINTSPTIGPFRGVVGTPCGHLDSSSNVTIFSRGFCCCCCCCCCICIICNVVCIGCCCICIGCCCGWMGKRIVLVVWVCDMGERRVVGGGIAMSPTPDRLNSLTLRGTKYSMWLSMGPADRRMGVLRWKAPDLRGSELYVPPKKSGCLSQDLGVTETDTSDTSSDGDGIGSWTPNFRNHRIISVCMRLKHIATTAMPIKMYAEAAYWAILPFGARSPNPIVPNDVKQKYRLSRTPHCWTLWNRTAPRVT